MELTEENYYSEESNKTWFSVSQYKSFMRCESAAMASIRGEYKQPITKALLVGSFVDSYFEGTLEQFKKDHPEVFTRKQELRAEFKRANEIISKIKQNDKFMAYMSGEKQRIFTGQLFGAMWKTKIDSFIPNTAIVDLKTVAKTYLLPNWRYDIQGAVYQKAVEVNGIGKLPFYLAVASKEKIPELNIFQIPQAVLDSALREVKENMPRFISVKNGFEEPKRCERCPWCKMTRELKVRNYLELLEDKT